MDTSATTPSPSDARWYRVYLAACLATLLSASVSHLLPSGESSDHSGPFKDFLLLALPEAWGALRGPDGLWQANRLLEQRMETLERQLEEKSHLRAFTAFNWLLATAGAPATETVYTGRDGRLILRGGFDYLIGPPFLDPAVLDRRQRAAATWRTAQKIDPRIAILDFHRQLEKRGIHLLFLAAPTMLMVHPEALIADATDRAGDRPRLNNPSFAVFQADLEQGGITVFDATETLIAQRLETGRDQYLHSDSHWTPEGLDAVARQLAHQIRRLNLPFEQASVSWQRRRQTLTRVGDLERNLLLPDWSKLFTPQTVEVQRVLGRRGEPWQADPRAEILILGDSFTNVFSDKTTGWGSSAGLPEQLSFYLKRSIDRIAINGGGAAATRHRLIREMATGRDRLAGKKLVIWQTAIRNLPRNDWPVLALNENPPDGPGAPREGF